MQFLTGMDHRTIDQRGSAGGRSRIHKYTLVDLVENINTDVKSEVADFDFESSSKPQVLVYFE